MKEIFSIIRIDKPEHEMEINIFKVHGRTLGLIQKNQIVYLNNNSNYPCIVNKIITYGVELENIEGAMGCEISIAINDQFSFDHQSFTLWG